MWHGAGHFCKVLCVFAHGKYDFLGRKKKERRKKERIPRNTIGSGQLITNRHYDYNEGKRTENRNVDKLNLP